jgi:hypothetical protein
MKKLIRLLVQKHIEVVRNHLQSLEAAASEQRLIVDELNRNCWMSTHAEEALVEIEIALINRRKHLGRLLARRPNGAAAGTGIHVFSEIL